MKSETLIFSLNFFSIVDQNDCRFRVLWQAQSDFEYCSSAWIRCYSIDRKLPPSIISLGEEKHCLASTEVRVSVLQGTQVGYIYSSAYIYLAWFFRFTWSSKGFFSSSKSWSKSALEGLTDDSLNTFQSDEITMPGTMNLTFHLSVINTNSIVRSALYCFKNQWRTSIQV